MKIFRTFLYLCSSAFICGCFTPAWAQCPPRTTVAETIFNADGSLAEGRIVIAWQTFAIGACQVPAGQATVNVTAGVLSVQLYPNTAAVPAGTSYRATYYLKSGRVTTEYWVVPVSGAPIGLAAVRSATAPVPNVMFGQSQVTNLGTDLAKKIELPSPCVAGKFLQSNGSAAPPQVNCVDGTGAGGGGSGTVTSVALSAPAQFSVSGSPVTTSGTLGLGWVNQNANLFVGGPASGGAAAPAFRTLTDDDVPNSISLINLTQIGTRNYADLQNIPSSFAPAAHGLAGAAHTASGLATGHFLKALSATSFGFAQITFSDLSGSIASPQQNNPAVGAKGGVEAKTCSGTDKISAIGADGIPVCGADQTGGGSNHALLSATHTDTASAAVARGAGIFGIGASPAWTLVQLSATDRYFKRNSSGDVAESSGAAAGTGACSNQFARALNADAAPTCASVATADLTDAAVTSAKLRDSAAVSVMGRSANSSGVPADIAAAADGAVLRRAAGAVGFGQVDLADADAVTGVLPAGNLPTTVVYDTATVTRDFPLTCTHPRVKSLAGNAFFDVEGLTTGDFDQLVAKFNDAVDGRIVCFGFVQNELAATPAAKIIFDVQPHVACGASQNFRVNLRYRFWGSGSADTALTAETAQDISGSTTAHSLTRATFPASGSLASAPTAGDNVIVEAQRDGAHANDNCAQVMEVIPSSVKLRVDVKVKN